MSWKFHWIARELHGTDRDGLFSDTDRGWRIRLSCHQTPFSDGNYVMRWQPVASVIIVANKTWILSHKAMKSIRNRYFAITFCTYRLINYPPGATINQSLFFCLSQYVHDALQIQISFHIRTYESRYNYPTSKWLCASISQQSETWAMHIACGRLRTLWKCTVYWLIQLYMSLINLHALPANIVLCIYRL